MASTSGTVSADLLVQLQALKEGSNKRGRSANVLFGLIVSVLLALSAIGLYRVKVEFDTLRSEILQERNRVAMLEKNFSDMDKKNAAFANVLEKYDFDIRNNKEEIDLFLRYWKQHKADIGSREQHDKK